MDDPRKDIVIINNKFERILDAWNSYLFNYPICQNKINFTSEVKTNYFGDIYYYFKETLEEIQQFDKNQFGVNLIQTIGVLQIIYVQQDLIDEILFIFKIQESDKKDKHVNREIRNQLIGHPIRRNKDSHNSLHSSVLWSSMKKSGSLSYVLYSKKNNFKIEDIEHSFEDIMSRHIQYTIKYLEKIENKIAIILRYFAKKLHELKSRLHINSEQTLIYANQICGSILEENFSLFNTEYIKWYYNTVHYHPRYKHANETLYQHIIEFINGTLINIETYQSNSKPELSDIGVFKVKIKFVKSEDAVLKKRTNQKRFFDYELSKLYDSSRFFFLELLKKHFVNDNEVYSELIHLESNTINDPEYHISIQYLKKLLLDRKLLNRKY